MVSHKFRRAQTHAISKYVDPELDWRKVYTRGQLDIAPTEYILSNMHPALLHYMFVVI